MRRALTAVFACGLIAAAALACGAFAAADSDEESVPDGSTGSDGTTGPSADADGDRAAMDGGHPTKDAGGDGASPLGCDGMAACERVVFITSEQFLPTSLGNVAGAHDKCNELAAAPTAHPRVKGRAFLAWLSDATTSPAAFMTSGTAPYVLPSGDRIANDWDALLNAALERAINQNEKGEVQTTSFVIWTGTLAAGDQAALRCNDWKTNDGGVVGTVGAANNTAQGYWSDRRNPEECNRDHRIYCFEK